MSKRIYLIPTERVNQNDPAWSAWLAKYGDQVVKSLAVTEDPMDEEHPDPDAQLNRADHIRQYGRESYLVATEGMKAARKIERSQR